LAANEKHFFADARADRIHRDERASSRLSFRRQRLNDQQFEAGEILVLACGHNVADNFGDLHACWDLRFPFYVSCSSIVSMTPTIAASTGQSFRPDAMRAELPLTMRTVSPTPASTVSIATRESP